jgi:hypothetical protein
MQAPIWRGAVAHTSPEINFFLPKKLRGSLGTFMENVML